MQWDIHRCVGAVDAHPLYGQRALTLPGDFVFACLDAATEESNDLVRHVGTSEYGLTAEIEAHNIFGDLGCRCLGDESAAVTEGLKFFEDRLFQR